MNNNGKIHIVKTLIDFPKVFNVKFGGLGGPNNTWQKISFPRFTSINIQRMNKHRRYIEKYGENYKEVIKKKWDMRKLSIKLKNKLPEKEITVKKGKI